jgi:type I restriction enzyme S subunit
MSLELGPYPEYRDSGIPWLGEIPAHWNIERLKTSVLGCINGTWGNDPDGYQDLACVRVADFDRYSLRVRFAEPTLRSVSTAERHRRTLQSGDLLLEKSGGGDLQPVGAVMLYDHDSEAVCSNFVARMPIAPGFDSRYLVYLHSHLYSIRLNVRSIKQTTGIQNLDSDAYLSELVAFPSTIEQREIAEFLDLQSIHAARLIRAKLRLIELLNEQKQAIIHRAVTRGLDPGVPMKPTGLDWLPEVPEHWDTVKIARIARVFNGTTPSRMQPQYWEEGTIPWLSSGKVNDYVVEEPSELITTRALGECSLSILRLVSIKILRLSCPREELEGDFCIIF